MLDTALLRDPDRGLAHVKDTLRPYLGEILNTSSKNPSYNMLQQICIVSLHFLHNFHFFRYEKVILHTAQFFFAGWALQRF